MCGAWEVALFKNILIVCIGNICRSPTAEHLLGAALSPCGIQVRSAGLAALRDHPLEPTAGQVLLEHGHIPQAHKARQLNVEAVSEADLILVMEQRHIDGVLNLAPEARGKVFLLGKWQQNLEITDPYRQGKPAFVQAYALIEQAVQAWARRLAR
ncbi:phosphotyrosine protein phosphatase [Pseudomonas sp. 2822-17]|nr:phosphotyrosine protein phosphatase [Pseudomonas sp. 2822-17]